MKHDDNSISEGYKIAWDWVIFSGFDDYTYMYCKATNDRQLNFVANFKFVHQLQNLYHALTGEELIVK